MNHIIERRQSNALPVYLFMKHPMQYILAVTTARLRRLDTPLFRLWRLRSRCFPMPEYVSEEISGTRGHPSLMLLLLLLSQKYPMPAAINSISHFAPALLSTSLCTTTFRLRSTAGSRKGDGVRRGLYETTFALRGSVLNMTSSRDAVVFCTAVDVRDVVAFFKGRFGRSV